MPLPTVTVEQLKQALDLAVRTKRPLMVRGRPGVGKSAVFQAFAAERGLAYIDSRALYFDPTDVKGFPALDLAAGVSRWLPPREFPLERNVESGGVPAEGLWVIEELVSAAPAVQAAFYQIMLDRQIGQERLAPGWAIVATGNRLADKGVVNRMPSPLVSRLWHVELESSESAWRRWAITNGIDETVIAFFALQPNKLNNFDPAKWEQDTPYACPRSVQFLSDLKKEWQSANPGGGKPPLWLVESTIGTAVGTAYWAFLDIYEQIPSFDQILLDPAGAPVPDRISAAWAIAAGIATRATRQNLARVMTYLRRLKKEFEVVAVREGIACRDDLVHTREFLAWASDNQGILA
jgi:hypothetical protein